MRRWLVGGAIVDDDGAVYSWSNPKHPGYPYPEAGGLLLSALCTEREMDGPRATLADRISGWLGRSIAPDGHVGRGGTAYLFDSAVVLAGLLRHRARGDRSADAEPIHRLHDFVRR